MIGKHSHHKRLSCHHMYIYLIKSHIFNIDHRVHFREVAAMANELRQLVDTANAPIFGIDVKGNVNEWNDKTAEITVSIQLSFVFLRSSYSHLTI